MTRTHETKRIDFEPDRFFPRTRTFLRIGVHQYVYTACTSYRLASYPSKLLARRRNSNLLVDTLQCRPLSRSGVDTACGTVSDSKTALNQPRYRPMSGSMKTQILIASTDKPFLRRNAWNGSDVSPTKRSSLNWLFFEVRRLTRLTTWRPWARAVAIKDCEHLVYTRKINVVRAQRRLCGIF